MAYDWHDRTRGNLYGAAAGLVSAAVALGTGELVSGLTGLASPVVAVADTVIALAPGPVERFAVETLGTNDKPALVAGTLVLTALLGVVFGIVARRRFPAGAAGFAAFALLGAAAALSGPTGSAADIIPSLVAGLAGVGALTLLLAPAAGTDGREAAADRTALEAVPSGPPGRRSRRQFLVLSAGLAATAAAGAAGGRFLARGMSAAASRLAVILPRPATAAPAVPAAASVGLDGVAPFITPNRDFYRVDTALFVPQVRTDEWRLRVRGRVGRPFELTFDELLERPMIERVITLTCVSNTVGGELVGTARWLGVPVRDLLDEAGVDPDADQLVGRSVDGWTGGFPLSACYDRDTIVAVGMNGEPLPLAHGFPARLVTPGLYGYVSATKWITELEVTRFDDFDAYWVRRGWADRAPIKTMARIDTPRSLSRIGPGPREVGGVAWAQTRGIERVEIRVDGGSWQETELGASLNRDTWRQWRFLWDAPPGSHRLTVRATDGTGAIQTEERAEPFPDGASGWMTVLVTVADQQT